MKPLAPEKALRYFRGLVPTLGIPDPRRWADGIHRHAFGLAVATDRELLTRVRDAIAERLDQGNAATGTQAVQQILDAAGVSPRNPQYAELVFRSNMMNAYNAGAREELQDPDVAADFPAWQYLGIADGRQRPEHAIHFDKYFSNATDFEEVRDSAFEGDYSGFNCRCTLKPIYKEEFRALQAEGVRLSTFAEKIPVPDRRQQRAYSCGAAALRAALAKFGIRRTEPELRKALGTHPERGTPPAAIHAQVQRHGLRSKPLHGMKLGELERHTSRGRLVLCPIQAHGPTAEFEADKHGHWVVVNGVDQGRVHYHDPVSGQRSLPAGEFVRRWHDRDGAGRSYRRFGIVVGPKTGQQFCGGSGGTPGPCPTSTGARTDRAERRQQHRDFLRQVKRAAPDDPWHDGYSNIPLGADDKLRMRLAGLVEDAHETTRSQARADAIRAYRPAARHAEAFCGGKGGKPGPCPLGRDKGTVAKPRVPEEEPSEKARRAKAAHKLVNKEIQRYAEEHNEPQFAKALGGVSFPDSEPVDVAVPGPSGAVAHGVELKTMVDNGNNKLTMDSYAQVRKIEWERAQGATFHTVVIDDTKVFNANGPGQHDETQRVYYYRRGVAGSARVGTMHRVEGGPKELKRLMNLPEKDLPAAAQRTDGKLRVGRWKFFQDEQGKGYRNGKTGQVVRAKK